MKKLLQVVPLAVMGALASQAFAAPMTYVGSAPFADSSVVLSPGTNGFAVDFGGGTLTTGSGITFQAGPASTASGAAGADVSTETLSGGQTVTLTNSDSTNYIPSSSSFVKTSTLPTAATLNNADANFGTIIGSGTYAHGTGTSLTLTLGNLTVDEDYRVQLFFADARSGDLFSERIRDVLSDTPSFDHSVTIGFYDSTNGNPNGYAGSYITIDFTADSSQSQSFVFSTIKSDGTTYSNGQVNAMVVQDLGPAASVPEPASLGVLGVGGIALLKRRRK